MTERSDPPAAGNGGEPAFEPFRLERETKPDGRAILFYSWPDEPPLPEGVGDVDASGSVPVGVRTPEAEPWSPESQPADDAAPLPDRSR